VTATSLYRHFYGDSHLSSSSFLWWQPPFIITIVIATVTSHHHCSWRYSPLVILFKVMAISHRPVKGYSHLSPHLMVTATSHYHF
jgi:hypothetical protein